MQPRQRLQRRELGRILLHRHHQLVRPIGRLPQLDQRQPQQHVEPRVEIDQAQRPGRRIHDRLPILLPEIDLRPQRLQGGAFGLGFQEGIQDRQRLVPASQVNQGRRRKTGQPGRQIPAIENGSQLRGRLLPVALEERLGDLLPDKLQSHALGALDPGAALERPALRLRLPLRDGIVLRRLLRPGVQLRFRLGGILFAAGAQLPQSLPPVRHPAEAGKGVKQVQGKAMFRRPLFPEPLQDRRRLVRLVSVRQGACQVVIQLPRGLPHCLRQVLRQRRDIPEGNHLFQRRRRGPGVLDHVRGMPPVFAGNIVPARDAPDLRRLFPGLDLGPAVHVRPHRQTEQRQHRGGDVQDGAAENLSAALQSWPRHHEDPEVPVLHRRARRLGRNPLGPRRVRVEPVVGDHQDVCVRSRQLEIPPQHGIVMAIDVGHHIPIKLELPLRHPFPPGRMILHEAVAGVVNGVKIDPREIPRLPLQQLGRGRMDGDRLREDLGQVMQRFVLCLVHLVKPRHKEPQHLPGYLGRAHPQLGKLLEQPGRGRHARQQRRQRRLRIIRHLLELIRHHRPGYRLGGIRGPPTDHHRAFSLLRQDVPQRLGLARQQAARPYRAPIPGRFGKAQHPVFGRAFARGNGGPQGRA